MNLTPDQITTIIGIVGAAITGILTAIGVYVAARAYSIRVNAQIRRENAVARVEVQRKRAETKLLEAQAFKIQAERDRVVSGQNADAFADLRQEVQQLRSQVALLSGSLDERNRITDGLEAKVEDLLKEVRASLIKHMDTPPDPEEAKRLIEVEADIRQAHDKKEQAK